MKLIETLQDEHVLIDQVLGSFRAYVDGFIDGTADPDDGGRFAAFFHRVRRPFPSRSRGAGFPSMRSSRTRNSRATADRCTPCCTSTPRWRRGCARCCRFSNSGRPSEDDRVRLRALATRYSHALWRHIDAENSVLYPEGVKRLRRSGVAELPDRPMSEAEAAAREGAAALLVRYPPVEDFALTRGDGCFMCRAHGETCDGLEAEWWTEIEWGGVLPRLTPVLKRLVRNDPSCCAGKPSSTSTPGPTPRAAASFWS
jgi:hypothetical protein